MQKKFIYVFLIMLFISKAFANNIYVNSFDELINSGSSSTSGDTITIINNLVSDSSIGNSFYTKNIYFQGENHSINGGDVFGGFVLSEGSLFNNLQIINCKGQVENSSSYAGAIYNSLGTTEINNTVFNNNYADSSGYYFAAGGAIYNANDGTVVINSSLFNNNYTNGASALGGAIGNNGSGVSMSIINSVFNNNYTDGTSVSYGGAIYNNSVATIEIQNSVFNNNYSLASDRQVFLYGGSIYNTGNMNIDSSYFSNNHIVGNNSSFSYGGAIHNNSVLNINNSVFTGNYITSDIDTSGGAIYNYVDGNITISNSTFEGNYLTSQNNRGGAIGNEGIITIINSTFKNNSDGSGANDIYNDNVINFAGSGTTNILDGIRGSGNIYKYDSGVLNLGGNNSNYSGNFSLESGTVNLLADSTYFNSQSTSFSNGVNFNMQNGQINNINYGAMNLSGQSNIYPDVNFNTNTMDTIGATSLSGSGSILVPNLALIGDPTASFISIPFADTTLKDVVNYQSRIIKTPIYDYLSSYNSSNGYFDFTREGFSADILASPIATQFAGYLAQIDTFNNVFSNLDMVKIIDRNKKTANSFKNKIAYMGQAPFLSTGTQLPEEHTGIWFRPYSVFESVSLKNGPKVSNVGYGGLLGIESGLKEHKNGWEGLYGLYAGYRGSHQAYRGIGIDNNGGVLGLNAAFYKKKFFSLWSANVGGNSSDAMTSFGKEDFTMLNTGISQKTGFNIPMFEDRFIFQPSIMTSYIFVKTFDCTNAAGVNISSKPLNALHIEPQIKLIGNFKDFLQPYVAVSFAWNILDDTQFQANDVYLPELSVKPYVRYGVGIQKRVKEIFTGFIQAYITNGGRNGIGIQLGLRWSVGKL